MVISLQNLVFEPVEIQTLEGSYYVVRAYLGKDANKDTAHTTCLAMNAKGNKLPDMGLDLAFHPEWSKSMEQFVLESSEHFPTREKAHIRALSCTSIATLEDTKIAQLIQEAEQRLGKPFNRQI
jgi:hypothetical protein